MRRALPAAAVTVIGLVALASFRSTKPAASFGGHALSHRVASGVTRSPTTTTPAAAAPPPDTAGPTTPRTNPTPTTRPSGRTGTFDGQTYYNQYGPVQVRLTMQSGHITAVTALQMPYEHSRSAYISQQAEPYLRQEALQAQSAQIDLVSGATYTSEGYAQSLQSALDRARA